MKQPLLPLATIVSALAMRSNHKSLFLLTIFIGLVGHVQAQTLEQRKKITGELLKLRDYSIAYDKYLKIYEKNPKYQSKKDSVGILYKAQIRKIKREPLRNEVLAFLNNATGKDSALYSNDKGYNYRSYNQLMSVRIRELPTLLEYFKAVKYSLFEQNKEELLHMRDIPFLKYKAKLSIESHIENPVQEQRRALVVELHKLREYSLAHDTYSRLAAKNEKYKSQRDSVGILYKNQVQKIKRGPQKDQFLTFLNNAIGKDSTNYSDVGYNYTWVNELLTTSVFKKPTLLEYFKVVRYSLFEKNRDRLLPMEDVPFLKYKVKAGSIYP